MQATTAILLFSRSAAVEASRKNFGATPEGNRRIARALCKRTDSTLARSGLPVFRIDEYAQRGINFGERIANAIEDVFRGGYASIIVVGNDCPGLRTGHLKTAASLLHTGSAVIGADRRGGAYLIGLQRSAYDRAAVLSLPWQSGQLFASLSALWPTANRLATLGDLNGLSDLRDGWHVLRSLLPSLRNLVSEGPSAFAFDRVATASPVARRLAGRAPPPVA